MQCSIPEEILLEIFKHITRKDLVSATQVSKRWNVSSNCLLYENLFCNESTLNKGLFKAIYGSKNGGLVRQLTIDASLYPIVIDMIISKCPFIVKLSFNSSSPSHQVDLAIGEMVKELAIIFHSCSKSLAQHPNILSGRQYHETLAEGNSLEQFGH